MRTHLDLFSGIGGFSIAAQMAGFKTVAFCEIEPYAQQILKEKFGAVMADAESVGHSWSLQASPGTQRRWSTEPRLHSDIFKLDGRDYAGVDLITGGFPCQPFSCAGKRRGKEDDRHLWPEMLRVIAEARPAWVLGENVTGIISMELDRVLSDLEGIGYAVWPIVIPAVAVDARHRRDRVWILAADTNSQPSTEQKREYQRAENNGGSGADGLAAGSDVVNTNGERQQHAGESESRERVAGEGQSTNRTAASPMRWDAEPAVGRVANGIPHWAHRLRGLGNAIVPQVAYEILKPLANLIDNENMHSM